ncbi:MAG: glucosaminidase domain-containing protein [Eubacterium sp.]
MINNSQQEFINQIGILAQNDMKNTGVLASLTIAQAILESGWGKSSLSTVGKALFGIKAGTSWKGKVYNAKTQECYDGSTFVTIDAAFRAYDSWEESISDHSALLCSLSRYKDVIGEIDYKKACKAIHSAGYATDPKYADKLINLIETYNLNQFDVIKEENIMSNITLDNTPDTWAVEAVEWAKTNGILKGDDNGNLKLHDVCTRQEVLVFLNRYDSLK